MDKPDEWRAAIIRAVIRRGGLDYLDKLADRLLDAAWADDMDAYRELGDILDKHETQTKD